MYPGKVTKISKNRNQRGDEGGDVMFQVKNYYNTIGEGKAKKYTQCVKIIFELDTHQQVAQPLNLSSKLAVCNRNIFT